MSWLLSLSGGPFHCHYSFLLHSIVSAACVRFALEPRWWLVLVCFSSCRPLVPLFFVSGVDIATLSRVDGSIFRFDPVSPALPVHCC